LNRFPADAYCGMDFFPYPRSLVKCSSTRGFYLRIRSMSSLCQYGCKSCSFIIVLCLWGPFAAHIAYGSIVATDLAANAAYASDPTGAWKGLNPTSGENPAGSDNGGSGFQPWDFAGGYHDPTVSPYGDLNHFIDGVDFSASAYNNLGSPAFGLTNANKANFGYTARATRVFSQPLAVGGTFTFEFDNPVLAPLSNNDTTGYIIRLNSGGGPKLATNPNVYERLGFFAQSGFNQSDWNITNSAGSNDTGLSSNATTSGAILRLTLQSAETYSLQILPLSGGNPLYSATGSLASPNLGSINTLEVLMFGNGSGNGLTGTGALPTGQREFFFNDLSLENPVSGLPGDYNSNGVVDAADYVVWRDTLNQSVSNGSGADGNSDGIVNQLDFDIWRSHFGQSTSSSVAALPNFDGEIPEPPTILTVSAALVCILLCSWRTDSAGVRNRCLNDDFLLPKIHRVSDRWEGRVLRTRCACHQT
jgi:hypothetical protein